MDNSYIFLKKVGKSLRGRNLIRYFFYEGNMLFVRALAYVLIWFILYVLSSITDLKIDLVFLEDYKKFELEHLFTIVCLIFLVYTIVHYFRIVAFLLFFWFFNYSCTCKILEYEDKPYGAISIRKVRVNSEEYNTCIYIDNSKRRTCSDTFTIATNAITKKIYIL